MIYTILWMLFGATFFVIEGVALDEDHSGTLSDKIFWLQHRWWGSGIVLAGWLWATNHLFIDKFVGWPTGWIDDAIFIIAGFAVGAWRYRKRTSS